MKHQIRCKRTSYQTKIPLIWLITFITMSAGCRWVKIYKTKNNHVFITIFTVEGLESVIFYPQACCQDEATGKSYKADENFVNLKNSYEESCKCHKTGKITCQKLCLLIVILKFLVLIY